MQVFMDISGSIFQLVSSPEFQLRSMDFRVWEVVVSQVKRPMNYAAY